MEGKCCGLFPNTHSETSYERGHKSTVLSKAAWPLIQLSLLLYIISFAAPNWCDGHSSEIGHNGRISSGAWRTCMASEVNTSLHPNGLPVVVCSDTAHYVVDGLKTGWVAAWRAFLILSFLLLLLTSVLVTVYLLGKRSQRHSIFPLFFSFASGFASVCFGTLALLVFYVKAGQTPELRGVAYGWAAGINVAAVVTVAYAILLIMGEFMEITDFRAARKTWRQRQHETITSGGDTATLQPDDPDSATNSSGGDMFSDHQGRHQQQQQLAHGVATTGRVPSATGSGVTGTGCRTKNGALMGTSTDRAAGLHYNDGFVNDENSSAIYEEAAKPVYEEVSSPVYAEIRPPAGLAVGSATQESLGQVDSSDDAVGTMKTDERMMRLAIFQTSTANMKQVNQLAGAEAAAATRRNSVDSPMATSIGNPKRMHTKGASLTSVFQTSPSRKSNSTNDISRALEAVPAHGTESDRNSATAAAMSTLNLPPLVGSGFIGLSGTKKSVLPPLNGKASSDSELSTGAKDQPSYSDITGKNLQLRKVTLRKNRKSSHVE